MKQIIAMLALAGLAVGCGKTEEEVTATATAIAELAGTWSTGCTNPSEGEYKKDSYIHSGLTLTRSMISYSDAACATKYLTFDITGTVTSPGDATTPAGAKKLNFTYVSATATIHTDAIVTAANASSLCGYTDFVKDVPKSVLGKTCGSGRAIGNTGEVGYDVYKITGTTLQLGDEDTVTGTPSDTNRPTALETTTFTKQ